jgi:hypothetical protein
MIGTCYSYPVGKLEEALELPIEEGDTVWQHIDAHFQYWKVQHVAEELTGQPFTMHDCHYVSRNEQGDSVTKTFLLLDGVRTHEVIVVLNHQADKYVLHY